MTALLNSAVSYKLMCFQKLSADGENWKKTSECFKLHTTLVAKTLAQNQAFSVKFWKTFT